MPKSINWSAGGGVDDFHIGAFFDNGIPITLFFVLPHHSFDNDIVFLENKSRGVQMATQTLIDFINENRPNC